MPTISVIIPCYNRATLLKRAIESVLAQTYQDFEILVVDDASSENLKTVTESFNDAKIHYFRQTTNKGAPAARNVGLTHAKGDYIAFLDSDDLWLENKLAEQLKAFNQDAKECGVVYCRFLKDSKPSRLPPASVDIRQHILTRNFVGTFSTPLIRKRCFAKSGVMDETLRSSQDWDLWIRIAQTETFFYLKTPLVHYFTQKESITRNHAAKYQGKQEIKRKYGEKIKSLPKNLRAEFHYNMGVDFYWNRDFSLSIQHFLSSLYFKPTMLKTIFNFLRARITRIKN